MLPHKQAAAELEISPRTLRDWAQAGCPKHDDGYDIEEVKLWRDTHGERTRTRGDMHARLQEAEARYREIKGELATLQLKFKKGELLDKAVVERGRVERILAVKSALQALPRQAAPSVVGMTDIVKIEEILRGIVENAIRSFGGEE